MSASRRCASLLSVVVISIWPLWLAAAAGADLRVSKPGPLLSFNGSCDASAAVLLEGNGVLVGTDWDNHLRIYPFEGGDVKATIDAYPITKVPRNAHRNTSAIEGAARLADRIYWIGSHARHTARGKTDVNRRRLFSLKLDKASGVEHTVPVDTFYSELLEDMSSSPQLAPVHIGGAIHHDTHVLPHLAPNQRGINIEGLAAMRDGRGLLLGLRNPIRGKFTLILPLQNPQQLVGREAKAEFGEPLQLDLGGLGIASLEYSAAHDAYFLMAARHDAESGFALFRWSGDPATPPTRLELSLPAGFAPQAMAISADGGRVLLLSDDGGVRMKVEARSECGGLLDDQLGCECMWLNDATRKSFRGLWLELERPRFDFRQPEP